MMESNEEKIEHLVHRLNSMLKQQEFFHREIHQLKKEIFDLQKEIKYAPKKEEGKTEIPSFVVEERIEESPVVQPRKPQPAAPSFLKSEPLIADLEKFIGEKLINKIGIIITVIGVAIGVKYSIEHQLISPLTRIILGYLFGTGLLLVALKLKKNYHNYSAVLLSGSMAIMYFITYSAYSFYGLIPNIVAFVMMFAFTAFTVIAAINYNQQVIAHIGLVGAYAIPFLLSEGSGRVDILYSYIAIINIGILVVAFKKYWKPLFYFAFSLTWIIFSSWFFLDFDFEKHATLALIFVSVFFAIFYAMFLVYKIINKEQFRWDDILILLINSFLFYGIGYVVVESYAAGDQYLGLFTVINAFIHFAVSYYISKKQLADKNIFYLIAGLVLVFITIAIPVQLDGNWVTLSWAGVTVLLFAIARLKKIQFYEWLSYPLMLITFISLLHDYNVVYNFYNFSNLFIRPIINIHFLTAILVVAGLGYILYLQRTQDLPASSEQGKNIQTIFSYIVPALLLFTLYYSFKMEIESYWEQEFFASTIALSESNSFTTEYRNYNLRHYKDIWLINYSMFFMLGLSLLNFYKIKNNTLSVTIILLNVLALANFLIAGLWTLSLLRDNYLYPNEYFHSGFFNILIRYISFILAGALLFITYKIINKETIHQRYYRIFDLFMHLTILWIISSEVITWMYYTGYSESAYKLGLSIFWGIYSLFLTAIGIWKKRKYLRVSAMILFSFILLKLFFYDISHLPTLSKTIVFVSLGLLLLIISFLYNKYKNNISIESEE